MPETASLELHSATRQSAYALALRFIAYLKEYHNSNPLQLDLQDFVSWEIQVP